MEENKIFEEAVEPVVSEDGKKPLDVAALVLSIVSIAFSWIPIVSYVCGIIGLVFAIKRRKVKRTKLALVFCIIGLALAVFFHVRATSRVFDAMRSAGIM